MQEWNRVKQLFDEREKGTLKKKEPAILVLENKSNVSNNI
jgi:hypothetical protein